MVLRGRSVDGSLTRSSDAVQSLLIEASSLPVPQRDFSLACGGKHSVSKAEGKTNHQTSYVTKTDRVLSLRTTGTKCTARGKSDTPCSHQLLRGSLFSPIRKRFTVNLWSEGSDDEMAAPSKNVTAVPGLSCRQSSSLWCEKAATRLCPRKIHVGDRTPSSGCPIETSRDCDKSTR
jgi:hypothetical protein